MDFLLVKMHRSKYSFGRSTEKVELMRTPNSVSMFQDDFDLYFPQLFFIAS